MADLKIDPATPATPATPAAVDPTKQAPDAGTAEHLAAMAAKADGTPATPATPAADPTLIAGKFKTQDDLVNAYKELEKKLGANAPATPATPADPAKTQGLDKIEPADIVTRAGLKQADLEASFTKDGKLTDEQYAALQTQGVSKQMVDAYLGGIKAQADVEVGKIQAIAGGPEEFGKVIQWARVNATPEQIKEYNAALDSGDFGRISASVSLFKAGFTNHNPQTVGGGAAPAVAGFRSQAEMSAAMLDPRYTKDEAYRQDVYNKVAASTFI